MNAGRILAAVMLVLICWLAIELAAAGWAWFSAHPVGTKP